MTVTHTRPGTPPVPAPAARRMHAAVRMYQQDRAALEDAHRRGTAAVWDTWHRMTTEADAMRDRALAEVNATRDRAEIAARAAMDARIIPGGQLPRRQPPQVIA